MDKFVIDQAEGLRRLVARRPLRIVTVLGPAAASGATTAARNLAAALRFHGKRALVIDEHAGQGQYPASLADIVEKRIALDDVLSPFDDEMQRGVPTLGAPAPLDDQADLLRHWRGDEQAAAMNGALDVVLVDARVGETGALTPLAAQAHDVLIVLDADPAAMPATYGLIKRLHFAQGIQQFRLLFNRVAQPIDAQTAYQNLKGVAMRYLGISLSPAGVISRDAVRLARADALGGCVVTAYPTAPAAIDYRRVGAEIVHWPWRPLAGVGHPQGGGDGGGSGGRAEGQSGMSGQAATGGTVGMDSAALRMAQSAASSGMTARRQEYRNGPQAMAAAMQRHAVPAHFA
ncbi:MinD/ParA family protein [Robbsia sp. KACC 23696]|uniref:MinD/ParA family ATP-binding protein n=1 Tax=Robbsia sp. KACC 23696 TaxID=3149231 RepID=UPI00325B4987